MFKRTTYQQGSLKLEERKRGPHVWVYRWWDTDANGKRVYRKQQVGDLEQYPNETAAKAAIDALRLTINNQSQRNGVSQMTVQALWDHYSREELPFRTSPRRMDTCRMPRTGFSRVGVLCYSRK